DELKSLTGAPAAGAPRAAREPVDTAAERRIVEVRRKLPGFLVSESVLGVLWSARGDDGTVFVDGSCSRQGSRSDPPQYWLAAEHYGRIWRILEKGIPVTVTIDSRVRFTDADGAQSFNVIAELPGTDRRDEVILLGAHLDSWTAGTGATDN